MKNISKLRYLKFCDNEMITSFKKVQFLVYIAGVSATTTGVVA